MKKNAKRRESEKAREIVKEYSKKGFDVILNPSKEQLPIELQNLSYLPDIIAKSDKINLIIEIKTASTIQDDMSFLTVVDKLKKIENWEFEFIYTNPTNINKSKNNIPYDFTYEEVQNNIDRVEKFISIETNSEFTDLGLILGWNTIISVLKMYINNDEKYNNQYPDSSLIRDAVMLGILSSEEQDYLKELMIKRNKVAHAGNIVTVSINELEKLVRFSKKLLQQTNL